MKTAYEGATYVFLKINTFLKIIFLLLFTMSSNQQQNEYTKNIQYAYTEYHRITAQKVFLS